MKFLFAIFYSTVFFAQTSSSNIGFGGHGLCFGNPLYHNGIKLNILDKNVERVNGVNLAIITKAKITNGLSIGLFAALDSCSNGVKVSCLGSDAGYHNGLVLAGLNIIGKKINGVGTALWTVSADTMNGMFVALNGGVAKWSRNDTIDLINGVAIGMLDVGAKKMNGFSFSFFISTFNKLNGVSVSMINKTKELNGVQFGLINYAGNNKSIFKWIPFFNFNFNKNDG